MDKNGRVNDFDFLFGSWTVTHRRLKERLVGCEDWEEFGGTCMAYPILGGAGNVDDNVVDLPAGRYRASSFRSFDTTSGTWAIWWLDQRNPHAVDVPVIGSFRDGVGKFLASDTLNGRPITVRFQWSDTQSELPIWEQAFSVDGGSIWETNWVMQFQRRLDGGRS
jgi:hypothetical protein